MRTFVTGGHGFIGSAVVRNLLRSGCRVRCLLRADSDTTRIDGMDVELALGDVRDGECLRRAMRGCDAVIHLAAPSSWTDIESPQMREIVVNGTATVLSAAMASGGLRTVYVSSFVAVDGTRTPQILNENSPWTLGGQGLTYASAKHDAEAECLRAASEGLPVVIVNPAEVYGPHDRKFITAGNLLDFARGNPVLVCSGGTSIAHVDDVAAGIVAALVRGRSGERYILGGENVTIRKLASLTLETLGLNRRIITVPNALVRAIVKISSALHIPLPFNPNVLAYATRYWCVDASKARNELGVSFRSARETISSVLQWLVSEGHLPACQPHFTEPPQSLHGPAAALEIAGDGLGNSIAGERDIELVLADAKLSDESRLLIDSHAA